ncbi:DNA repair protein RecO [Pectinatus haikarae]|uniref:DNA repair protein RecO n=1 Tax=Pectinatus haikarae TaxID=349096 RepID=A0ABT9YBB7_9FIRM|nr:DNA repair protein RecO [Pectinatus haikarae]MDQ0205135.1 DNA repair protein RecO (recombination protein O) [Pectinatus haikarae]
MSLYNIRAIVLGAVNWGEADKLITLFSRDRGKIKAAAYGCRRPRSRLASAAQLFSILELQLSEGPRLDIIKNCDHNGFLADFSLDYTALAYASFVAEIVAEIFEENQPQEQVYEKLLQIIPAMLKRNPRVVALAAFFQILEYTGSQLQYEYCAVCGRKIEDDAFFSYEEGGAVCQKCRKDENMIYSSTVRKLILHLLNLDWQAPSSFNIQAKNLLSAEKIMLDYLEIILEKRLKSLDFIKQITK